MASTAMLPVKVQTYASSGFIPQLYKFVWIQHANTTPITSSPNDGDKDSLWNIRFQGHIYTADHSGRLHCILLLWKLQSIDIFKLTHAVIVVNTDDISIHYFLKITVNFIWNVKLIIDSRTWAVGVVCWQYQILYNAMSIKTKEFYFSLLRK
jgi:hypothetical protein